MLILADHQLPAAAIRQLEKYGEVIPLETSGIVYDSISGHPDVFFFLSPKGLVVAPNLPDKYKAVLASGGISFTAGEIPVGPEYPSTAAYNGVATGDYLIHNFRYTDPAILALCDDLDLIHVNQGYCRCNLLPLRDNHFITSDRGIQRVLEHYTFDVLYTDPSGIILSGAGHGFFGGCCGIREENIYISGSLDHYAPGPRIREFLNKLGYQTIELYNGPLVDGGSILFLD